MSGLLGGMTVAVVNVYFGIVTLINIVDTFLHNDKIRILKYIITIALAIVSAAIYGIGALIGIDYGEIITEVFYVLSIVLPTIFLMVLMIESSVKIYFKWNKNLKVVVSLVALLYIAAAFIVLAQTVMGLMYLEYGDQLRREHFFEI